mmetsp:Transcript_109267/g.326790  ORF Transcript_109267/g.326790 Transcript_109267/m.326790 type:complete len:133 (+) Transcript_109267:53-451(+)
MPFACHARWARCRAAQASPWARRVNFAAFDGQRRGLAAAPALRILCSERLPALSFPEQRVAATGLFQQGGDVCKEAGEDELLGLLLDQLTANGSMVLLAETLGICISKCIVPHQGSEEEIRSAGRAGGPERP